MMTKTDCCRKIMYSPL
uniref:Uncharacterized protein n=1 Tax=Romanomermis culicivorax TaxID=13658 RepID=A0A915KYR3_ROMCU